MSTEPIEGVTRCECGSKYWDSRKTATGVTVWRCHSCKWRWRPSEEEEVTSKCAECGVPLPAGPHDHYEGCQNNLAQRSVLDQMADAATLQAFASWVIRGNG